MKIRSIFVAVALVAASAQSYAADWEFTIDSSDTWLGWLESTVWSGAYGAGDLRANFTDSTTLSLQSNVLAQDNDPGGWSGATILANSYQEVVGTIGDTVTFDWVTISDTLTAAGYTAQGFIKVLDGGASWATTQHETFDITSLGAGNVSLTVADAGAGTEVIQAGFAITGLSDTTGSGTDTLSLNVIPEPATFGLLGIVGAGLLFVRRRFSI